MPREPLADPENAFLEHLKLIERTATYIALKHRLSEGDVEEFASQVKLEFIKDDYARMRNYRGDSSLRTFITAVIANLCLDYQTSKWGKWRPSAAAKRAGPLAVLLEQLLVRDGLGLEEAYETLWTNHQVSLRRGELDAIVAGLPPRTPRRVEGDDELVHVPASAPAPDHGVADAADTKTEKRAKATVQTVLATFTSQDRLILFLIHVDGLTVATVARQLGLAQAPLYRRIEQLLKQLRAGFAQAHLDNATLLPLLEKWTVEFDWIDDDAKDDRPVRPPDQRSEKGGRDE